MTPAEIERIARRIHEVYRARQQALKRKTPKTWSQLSARARNEYLHVGREIAPLVEVLEHIGGTYTLKDGGVVFCYQCHWALDDDGEHAVCPPTCSGRLARVALRPWVEDTTAERADNDAALKPWTDPTE